MNPGRKGGIMSERGWDDVYRNYRLEDIPWHTRQPDRNLVRLVREKRFFYSVFMEKKEPGN
jgi:hypothetical protein